ncbi:hypothetical protein [Dysgonomonas sp. 511]|nr:hypothetical protein [Dysgonomonas sp. 511]
MEILDKKSTEINSFFTGLEELLDTIGKALKNRTPRDCKQNCVSER